MRRAPFLGAAGATLLAGCGGHGSVLNAVAGLAPGVSRPSTSALVMVPAIAEPIPDFVLTHPIIGEARRFDGATAPIGWMLAQGQSLKVADYRQLFSIIGTIGGGDGKAAFMLPSPKFGAIVAVAGIFPTTQAQLALTGRDMSLKASLGPHATQRAPKMQKPPSQQLLAQQRLANSQPRVASSRAEPMSPELTARIEQQTDSAKQAAFGRLNPGNQARLQRVVSRVIAGSATVYDAIVEMRGALSSAEANELLAVNDARIRAFNNGFPGTPRTNTQDSAAHFLLSVAITKEQAGSLGDR